MTDCEELELACKMLLELDYLSLGNDNLSDQGLQLLDEIADLVESDYDTLCPVMESYGINY